MFGIVPKVLWEKRKPADDRNRVAMDMNCLLIRDADHVVLVETGAGPKLTERQKEIFGIDAPPRLLEELRARGVRPEQVTLVVNTHLHFDHSGGNTYRDGDRVVPTFPRASYVFQRLEWEDATHPNERTRGSYLPDDYAPLEAAGKLELVDEAVEILPGIRLDRVQGHTRGTQTVRVSDGGATLFFTSDFMPDRHHLPLPWIPAFDLFPLDTLAAKKVILRRAVDERLSQLATAFWRSFAEQTGARHDFQQRGYLFIAETEEGVRQLRDPLPLYERLRVPVRMVDRVEIAELVPSMRVDDLAGGRFCPRDGYGDPLGALAGLAAAARLGRVTFRESVAVTSLVRDGDRVTGVRTASGDVVARRVLVAAGCWTSALCASAAVPVPTLPERRSAL